MISTDDDWIQQVALAAHLRRYIKVCTNVEAILQNYGWRNIVSALRKIPDWNALDPQEVIRESRRAWNGDNGIHPIRRGTLRDSLLRVLGLEPVAGIDTDLLKTFGRFKACDLTELREKVAGKARKVLRTQIENKCTYFLNTSKIIDTPFESLIPLIRQARADELVELGDTSDYGKVLVTYYGFAHRTGTATPEDEENMQGILETPIKRQGTGPSFQTHLFPHCSDELAFLLLNILRVAITRPQTQKKGVEALGETGDSRALEVLHWRLLVQTENSVLCRIITALAGIGDPSSLRYLKPYLGHYRLDSVAYEAISCIKHAEAFDTLIEHIENGSNFQKHDAMRVLWRPRDPRAIPYLLEELEEGHWISDAVSSLLYLGKPGHEAVLDNIPLLKHALYRKENRLASDQMETIVKHMPHIVDNVEFIAVLTEFIGKSDIRLRCHSLFEEIPELLEHVEIRASILRAVRRSRHPIGVIANAFELGLLNDDEFFSAAEKRLQIAAREVVELGRGHRYWTMSHVCKVPLLYSSKRIHEAIAHVIAYSTRPCSVFSGVSKDTGLSKNPIIHDAVVERLTTDPNPTALLKKVVLVPQMMREARIQEAVAEALNSLWSEEKHARSAVWVDYDSYEYDWVYILQPLNNYPELAHLEAFQEAVSFLLMHSDYRTGVLRHIEGFPGIMESKNS